MKKILMFDLFDTLLKKEWFDYSKIQSTLCEHISEVSEEEFVKLSANYRNKFMLNRDETTMEVSFNHQLHYYESMLNKEFDIDLLELEWICFKACRKESLIDGAKELLVDLQKHGYHLAIISNSIFSSKTLMRYMDEFDIGDYFEFVLSSADVGCRKPSSKIFDTACRTFNVTPNKSIVFVGNNYEKDVIGSASAGLMPILYDPHACNHDCTSINKLSDLMIIVNTLER